MMYDAVIIGGGASGIFVAINARKNAKIAIIEQSDRLGKKILATGNGRCNITNMNLNSSYYNDTNVERYFNQINNAQTIELFAKMGLEIYADEEGRCYPLSNSANSVLDTLLLQLHQRGNIDILYNSSVAEVSKVDGVFHIVLSNGKTIDARKVVIATGGNSGSMLDKFDIKYNNFRPSLVSLKSARNVGLDGVRVSNVKVTSGNFCEIGEVLFKEDAISGIVIFNLSSMLARRNNYTATVSIDLIPKISMVDMLNKFKRCKSNNPNYTLLEMLEGYLHKALCKNILNKYEFDNMQLSNTSVEIFKRLIHCVKNYTVFVGNYGNNYQVQSGGVGLANLDDSLMCIDNKGVYVVGEACDVDGVCGGYNLQWAWTSAKIVGDNI